MTPQISEINSTGQCDLTYSTAIKSSKASQPGNPRGPARAAIGCRRRARLVAYLNGFAVARRAILRTPLCQQVACRDLEDAPFGSRLFRVRISPVNQTRPLSFALIVAKGQRVGFNRSRVLCTAKQDRLKLIVYGLLGSRIEYGSEVERDLAYVILDT